MSDFDELIKEVVIRAQRSQAADDDDIAEEENALEYTRKALTDAISAVTSERDKYRDMVNEGTRDIMLNEFNMRGAHFEIELRHPVFSVMAIQAAQYLTEKKADNYVEMKVWTKEHGDVTITVKKCQGKTPHELRKEAEQERDELKAYCDKLAAGLPDGMLPKDIENLREANGKLAQENFELKAKLAEANGFIDDLGDFLLCVDQPHDLHCAHYRNDDKSCDCEYSNLLKRFVDHRARLAKDES